MGFQETRIFITALAQALRCFLYRGRFIQSPISQPSLKSICVSAILKVSFPQVSPLKLHQHFLIVPYILSGHSMLNQHTLLNHFKLDRLRPGADQPSKAAFGKSAFAKTCFLLLKTRLAHTNRAKSKNAFEHVLAGFQQKVFCSLHVPKRARKYFCFMLDWCAPDISLTKEATLEHVFSKSAFAKSSFARLVCARPQSPIKFF